MLKAGPGRFPVGITLAMQDYQAVPGGESQRDEARRISFDPFLDAARHDDFVGVQTYSRVRFDASGPIGPEPGVPVLVCPDRHLAGAVDRLGTPLAAGEP